LDNHQPRAPKPTFDGPATGFEDVADSEPNFPKSLFLLRPLFTAYELNPVASGAQASVPVPAGLDLDDWIVPPPPSEEPADSGELVAERKTKKSKKGKEKESGTNGAKTKDGKKRKKHREGYEDVLEQPEETPEEAAERERVCHSKGFK
jgi:AP-3 complex subunit delta